MTTVEIYTKEHCTFCARAKALLTHKNVKYKEIHVDQDPKALETMVSRAKGRRTVPQIFIGDKAIGGYDDLYALEQQGKLDTLLNQ